MAEIKIKKKAPFWPWIVGALLVAALIYFLVFADDANDDVDDVITTTTEQPMQNDGMENSSNLSDSNEINEYVAFVSDSNMNVDHEYSSAALTKLIAATRATANEVGVDINADLSAATTLSDEITNDPKSLTHSNKIKDAAGKIAQALKTIQTEKFSQLDSQFSDVETAVSNI